MSLLVVGLSHRSAPVSLLERAALDPSVAAKLQDALAGSEHVSEALVLSTCNRVELYADVDKFHGGVSTLTELFSAHSGIQLDELTSHLYVHYEDRAVSHLFAVACGLDSMVVGESQILGQVRLALRAAQEGGTTGRALNELLQQALRVGKRAHAETDIDAAGRSLVTLGLDVAAAHLGGLAGKRVLLIGAGAMSALTAATLSRYAPASIVVANRTPTHAERLAEAAGSRAVSLSSIEPEIAAADLVVSCTGAIGLVVRADLVARARIARGEAEQFFLDLALPRDIDPEIAGLPGITLTGLDELAGAAHDQGQSGDVEAVRQIVADETADFINAARAATVAPTVVALRSMADLVVASELDRLATRLPEVDERARAEIALTVRRVVDKLLHAPTVRVKMLAQSPGGHSYAEALRELFDLNQATVEAIASPEIEDGPQ